MPQPSGADALGTLPLAGGAAPGGSAQALAIASTPQVGLNAVDTGVPADTPNLFLLFTVVIMAIPILVTMTLLATVLTRR